jgi:hypothetical protein
VTPSCSPLQGPLMEDGGCISYDGGDTPMNPLTTFPPTDPPTTNPPAMYSFHRQIVPRQIHPQAFDRPTVSRQIFIAVVSPSPASLASTTPVHVQGMGTVPMKRARRVGNNIITAKTNSNVSRNLFTPWNTIQVRKKRNSWYSKSKMVPNY